MCLPEDALNIILLMFPKDWRGPDQEPRPGTAGSCLESRACPTLQGALPEGMAQGLGVRLFSENVAIDEQEYTVMEFSSLFSFNNLKRGFCATIT